MKGLFRVSSGLQFWFCAALFGFFVKSLKLELMLYQRGLLRSDRNVSFVSFFSNSKIRYEKNSATKYTKTIKNEKILNLQTRGFSIRDNW